jgi:sulfide:quinone oxidoreductase
MGPPTVLKEHPELTNEAGFLCVDPKTLRHIRYPNIFGLGDCTSTPNSKTMAAVGEIVASQHPNEPHEIRAKV